MNFRLPDNFLLGVSSAADQIEGGEVGSNWNDWYAKGKIKDGSDPAVSDMHWERWREDSDLMAEMGIRTARIGVSWSRIEPSENVFDNAVMQRYREEISYLKEKGINVLLTIHHFGNPMWFEQKGGFAKKENLTLFLDFGKYVAEHTADLVSDYITINEPNVYAMNGFFGGNWPPGKNSFGEYRRVLSNMAYCHIALYRAIHSKREALGYSDTMVSFANHLRVFEPKNPGLFSRICCHFAKMCFQTSVTRAMLLGEFGFPLKAPCGVKRGEYADFIGINYYSRSAISGMEDGSFDNVPRNDLGWEIYPEGIAKAAEECIELLNRPIWVTENGTCDNTDSFRSRYIAEHLKVIAKSGLPFERYYHWCFTDNFEWMEGESARFGLVHVNYETQERTPKTSAAFYSELIKENGVSEEMFKKYIEWQEYRID